MRVFTCWVCECWLIKLPSPSPSLSRSSFSRNKTKERIVLPPAASWSSHVEIEAPWGKKTWLSLWLNKILRLLMKLNFLHSQKVQKTKVFSSQTRTCFFLDFFMTFAFIKKGVHYVTLQQRTRDKHC